MGVSAVHYHIHSLQRCQEADDTKLIFHPIIYLQFLARQAGRISSRNSLLLLSMTAADLLSIFLSTLIHSFICDSLPALRPLALGVVPLISYNSRIGMLQGREMWPGRTK